MEEKIENIERESSFPIIKILLRNALMIVLVTVLGALIALSLSITNAPPIYTASHSMIFRTTVEGGENQAGLQAAVAKRYFTTLEEVINSPEVINEVNKEYKKEQTTQDPQTENFKVVSVGAVGMRYKNDSLIFQITYTDLDKELAVEKLQVFIKTISESNVVKDKIIADEVEFVPTQRHSEISKSTSYTRHTIYGAIAGLVVSVAIAFLLHMLDNTVRDKGEFEELTGVNVIAYINKDKFSKK